MTLENYKGIAIQHNLDQTDYCAYVGMHLNANHPYRKNDTCVKIFFNCITCGVERQDVTPGASQWHCTGCNEKVEKLAESLKIQNPGFMSQGLGLPSEILKKLTIL